MESFGDSIVWFGKIGEIEIVKEFKDYSECLDCDGCARKGCCWEIVEGEYWICGGIWMDFIVEVLLAK